MGAIVGGFLWTYVFGAILGKFAWRDWEPDAKALRVSFSAAAFVAVIMTIQLSVIAGLVSAIGSYLAYLLLRRDYRRKWLPDSDADTFE